ncbi:MAG: AmmeMemoRadiSam system protein B [Gammaproteobacteria bacterium]
MSNVRLAAVAGHFYPDDPEELRQRVCEYLAAAARLPDVALPDRPLPDRPLRAIIAPHAGYVYSGPVAASAYSSLVPARQSVRRVVLLGPSHRVYLKGVARSTAEAFRTPLGDVPLDEAARLSALSDVTPNDRAHLAEHSIEVHLPFLQVVLEHFTIVPLVVGDAGPEEVGEVIERLSGGPETLVVVSSDLSHYLDYESATRRDRETTLAIEARCTDLAPEQACGSAPINGLLHYALRMRLTVTTLDLRNSGDTAGPRHQVVGYGAYAIH